MTSDRAWKTIADCPQLTALGAPLVCAPGVQVAVGTIGGRSVLIALLGDGGHAGLEITARHAASLSVPAVAVSIAALESASVPRRPVGVALAVVAPQPEGIVATALAARGVLQVTIGAESSGLLGAPEFADAFARACVLQSFLPARLGAPAPRYRPGAEPNGEAVDAVSSFAMARLHALCDDVLRVFPGDTDELVFALGRVAGSGAVFLVPQPIAGGSLSEEALVALVSALRLAARFSLPLVVLGNIPEPTRPTLWWETVAVAIAELTAPVLSEERVGGGTVQQLLSDAQEVIRIPPHATRDSLRSWLTTTPLSPL